MANASEIRTHLADWLDGKFSLAEFEDWFVPETWNVHKSNDPEAESLADEIELRLSEYSGGHLRAEQLREELKELANSNRSLVSQVNVLHYGEKTSSSEGVKKS